MIVKYQYEEWTSSPTARKIKRTMHVLDQPIEYSIPFLHLYRTADGGIALDHKDWDEHDHLHRVTINLTRADLEAVKDMIKRNLL